MYCLFIVHIRVQQLLKTCWKLIIDLSWLKSYLAIVSQRPAVLFVCLCFFSTLCFTLKLNHSSSFVCATGIL